MLLRDLDPPELCNGMRLTVKTLSPNLIKAIITTGCASGEDVFNPRIPIKPIDMLCKFKQTQFPEQLSFFDDYQSARSDIKKILACI